MNSPNNPTDAAILRLINHDDIDADATDTIIIGGEKYDIKTYYEMVFSSASVVSIETWEGEEFHIAPTSDDAGKVARERWADMAENDRGEFVCCIGEDRLVGWALGESDSFGIHSLEEFLDVVEQHPEEELASYDCSERDVDGCSRDVIDALGFVPGVAYRSN